jgi:hypothetical protein
VERSPRPPSLLAIPAAAPTSHTVAPRVIHSTTVTSATTMTTKSTGAMISAATALEALSAFTSRRGFRLPSHRLRPCSDPGTTNATGNLASLMSDRRDAFSPPPSPIYTAHGA